PAPFTLVKEHPGVVTDISPFWYEVTGTGSIISKPQGDAAQLAKEDHLPLTPLFNNAGANDTILQSTASEDTAIHNIVSIVKKNHYAGVDIDFQQLKDSDRAGMTRFVQQLRKALPSSDIISVSVVPLTSQNGQTGAYDFPALAKSATYLVLMAYDLHGNGTQPGPVSPYKWVKQSIELSLKSGVPAQKLFLGIADYGYLWTGNSTKATAVPLKVMYQHKYGAYKWNSTYKEAYDTYTSGGVKHVIWFDNDRAAVDRIKLAEQYHLGGIAIWRLGYEDAKWWDAIVPALQHKPMPPHESPQHKASTSHPASKTPDKSQHKDTCEDPEVTCVYKHSSSS
ncbi:MAG: glycosyl hydrolase family 18 protein, partial [Firmicutes bacterium]|nr:glycosyl hydrolase family 18 protein [Bacillota bacterium]